MTHLRELAESHPFPTPSPVRLGDIYRDPEVASIPLRAEHIKELSETFKPHLVGLPIVSRREDGQIVVLNGSHRCEALRQLFGEELELDVSLYDGLTREQEVAIFERHHKKFLQGESRAAVTADDDESHIWSFDIDDCLTSAPLQFARLSEALHAVNDQVVCVTGHGPEQTRQELLDAIGFKADQIIIVDPEPDGSGKAKVLKELGAWFHFDNEIAYGPAILAVCPVTMQFVEPPGDVKPKKAAKKAAADLANRSLRDRFHGPSSFREIRSPYAEADEDGDWA